MLYLFFFFFFKQKTAYEISSRDWSSDVCSSDLLFRRQAALDDDHLLAYARELALDAERVARELERQVHRARVLEDIQSGLQSGVSGTPMFFINGRRHEEPGDARTLRAALLRAI